MISLNNLMLPIAQPRMVCKVILIVKIIIFNDLSHVVKWSVSHVWYHSSIFGSNNLKWITNRLYRRFTYPCVPHSFSHSAEDHWLTRAGCETKHRERRYKDHKCVPTLLLTFCEQHRAPIPFFKTVHNYKQLHLKHIMKKNNLCLSQTFKAIYLCIFTSMSKWV